MLEEFGLHVWTLEEAGKVRNAQLLSVKSWHYVPSPSPPYQL
jgi:hypothetical protein